MEIPALQIFMGQTTMVLVPTIDNPKTKKVRMSDFDDRLSYEPYFVFISTGIWFRWKQTFNLMVPDFEFVTVVTKDSGSLFEGGQTSRKTANCFRALSESDSVFRERACRIV